jgi:hypothetical protein
MYVSSGCQSRAERTLLIWSGRWWGEYLGNRDASLGDQDRFACLAHVFQDREARRFELCDCDGFHLKPQHRGYESFTL